MNTKINLFCLPFAGGNIYSYQSYLKYAPQELNIIPLELPGRGRRFGEALLTNIHAVAEDIYQKMKYRLNEPYAIYGHSLGTLLGYLVTQRIIQEHQHQPEYLFFTGRAGPSVALKEPPRYLLPREAFFKKIADLGGTPSEILEDEDMKDIFEPILRADFETVETFKYQAILPFEIPVNVIIGDQEDITLQDAWAWQQETTIPIEVAQMAGKHFFIFSNAQKIVEVICHKLESLEMELV